MAGLARPFPNVAHSEAAPRFGVVEGQHMSHIIWMNQLPVTPRKYVCGYCTSTVGPDKGLATSNHPVRQLFLYICSNCAQPTFFDVDDKQFPGVKYGGDVKHLPVEVGTLYDEARSCMSSLAYTPAVLACRKILMNVTVSLGAKPGEPFVSYVQYLADNGFIPPNGKGWVDISGRNQTKRIMKSL
jgi:hypothetical protein